ncbi:MAG: hypothetical protein MUQ60_08195 [Porticoccaceae bacterium]|nr:hypothetical protein [Porticoccaceae bacterium]
MVTALPFSIILVLATYGLCKSLYQEEKSVSTLKQANN